MSLRNTKLIVVILLMIFPTLHIMGQTTYSYSPTGYTSCPTADYGTCASWDIHGDGVLKMKVDEITSTHFIFLVEKCAGTFSNCVFRLN